MSFQSLEGFVLNVMSWSVCIHLLSFSCSMSYSISLCLDVFGVFGCVGEFLVLDIVISVVCVVGFFCLICLLKVGLKFLILPVVMYVLLAFRMMVLKCCTGQSLLL